METEVMNSRMAVPQGGGDALITSCDKWGGGALSLSSSGGISTDVSI